MLWILLRLVVVNGSDHGRCLKDGVLLLCLVLCHAVVQQLCASLLLQKGAATALVLFDDE